MNVKIKFEVNPRAGKELVKQIEKNLRRRGIKAKIDPSLEKKLQTSIEQLGK